MKWELRRRMHQPVLEQGKWLRQVVTGYFNDHAVPTNSRALSAFRFFVIRTLETHAPAPQPDRWHEVGDDQSPRL
ncbi:hypothetical protein ACVWXO_010826 [Bradyrhizobium sp. LM2.7]